MQCGLVQAPRKLPARARVKRQYIPCAYDTKALKLEVRNCSCVVAVKLLLYTITMCSFCAYSALTLLVGWQEGHPACKILEWWGTGMVICLERDADLHMAQLMPLPLTISCFSTIQIGFTFLVPTHLGSPRKGVVKWVYVCMCSFMFKRHSVVGPTFLHYGIVCFPKVAVESAAEQVCKFVGILDFPKMTESDDIRIWILSQAQLPVS